MTTEQIVLGALALLVGSGGGGFVAAWLALKRLPHDITKEDAEAGKARADTAQIYEAMAGKLTAENVDLRRMTDEQEKRIQRLEAALPGPFGVRVEVVTFPELKVLKAEVFPVKPETA